MAILPPVVVIDSKALLPIPILPSPPVAAPSAFIPTAKLLNPVETVVRALQPIAMLLLLVPSSFAKALVPKPIDVASGCSNLVKLNVAAESNPPPAATAAQVNPPVLPD